MVLHASWLIGRNEKTLIGEGLSRSHIACSSLQTLGRFANCHLPSPMPINVLPIPQYPVLIYNILDSIIRELHELHLYQLWHSLIGCVQREYDITEISRANFEWDATVLSIVRVTACENAKVLQPRERYLQGNLPVFGVARAWRCPELDHLVELL